MAKWVHDINQPLTAINNYASAVHTILSEHIRLAIPVPESDARRMVQWLDEIYNQTNRVATLVDDQEKWIQEHSKIATDATDNGQVPSDRFREGP
jgi:phosphoglycerate-specific signal transduction histidine kinase